MVGQKWDVRGNNVFSSGVLLFVVDQLWLCHLLLPYFLLKSFSFLVRSHNSGVLVNGVLEHGHWMTLGSWRADYAGVTCQVIFCLQVFKWTRLLCAVALMKNSLYWNHSPVVIFITGVLEHDCWMTVGSWSATYAGVICQVVFWLQVCLATIVPCLWVTVGLSESRFYSFCSWSYRWPSVRGCVGLRLKLTDLLVSQLLGAGRPKYMFDE